ncbi:MAG TPA: AAA family ATPase [Candidatus Nanopelagicales bacterium]|nr:AAA family ATPase [Candidatus Nanopelagicales bacterium]
MSVMFVDLVDSTAFAESRDAEEVRAVLDRYFSDAGDAVARHGGRVEKFIGDAIMAVWGTPVAHEDDAERAVRSALEIVDRVDGLGRELGLPLQARGGVLTGEAVATLDATDQGLVTGDLVNTAARLQSAAAPGCVIVGDSTQRATNQSIAYEPIPPMTMKGKADPVTGYRALRVISELGGANRQAAPEPPFVGRDEQLRLTKELLHATGREGRPRLLHVSGVAGIGKSRLVWELQKYLDGLTEDVYWHAGRCPSYGEGVTFWALAEMVRARAGIAETDDAGSSRILLHECLADLVPDEDERAWVEPRLGHLLGLEGAPAGDRDELFAAWRRFFERVAERGTVALVVEDLHWADAGLMDFLDALLEASRTSPILVLTLARPELMDRRPSWGHGVRSSAVVHLDRLDDDEIRALVSGYVHGLPDDGLQRLTERAEGVPMYAVETVRMLADRGVLEQRDESYVVVGELGRELDIPETLHALVAARLDGLPDTERALVQDASVTGHSFTREAVGAVSGVQPGELDSDLRALVRKEVLDQDLDPRSPERGQYRFVQSVIKEVAYATLTKPARRAKHLACAQYFESQGDEELTGVVATHYLEAFRAEPSAPEADTVAQSARTWLGRASDRALALGSTDPALATALVALTLADAPADRAPFHHRAAVAAAYIGDMEESWTHLEAATADYLAADDLVSLARMLTHPHVLGRFELERRGRIRAWLTDVEQRLPRSERAARATVLATLADAASGEGRFADSLELSEPALIEAQASHDDAALTLAAAARSWALSNAGRHFESRLLGEEVLRRARATGSPVVVARAALALSISVSEEDPRSALSLGLETADQAGLAGARALQVQALGNSAEAAVDLGDWTTAERAIDEAEAIGAGDQIERDALALTRCMLTAYRGDPESAERTVTEMRDDHGDLWLTTLQFRTWHKRIHALTLHVAGRSAEALAVVREAIELEPAGANTPVVLWLGVQAAADLRAADPLRDLLAATDALRGQWISAVRSTAAAVLLGVAPAADPEATVRACRESLQVWAGLELPLDLALATLCVARIIDVPEAFDAEVRDARRYLEQLGAEGLLRLLSRASAA